MRLSCKAASFEIVRKVEAAELTEFFCRGKHWDALPEDLFELLAVIRNLKRSASRKLECAWTE